MRWFEVWTEYDGSYVLVLKSLSNGKFEVFDPQTGKVDSTYDSYEAASENLSEDEFTQVDGRMDEDADDEAAE